MNTLLTVNENRDMSVCCYQIVHCVSVLIDVHPFSQSRQCSSFGSLHQWASHSFIIWTWYVPHQHSHGGKPNRRGLASNTVAPAKNQRLLLAISVLSKCCHGNVAQDFMFLCKMPSFRGKSLFLASCWLGFPRVNENNSLARYNIYCVNQL